MLHELGLRLSKVLEQKRRKEKLAQDRLAVETELREQSAQLDVLTTQLNKEQVDVDRLERTSLTSLFYSILGSREEQLDKERQDLLSAQLKHGQVKHQVEYLQRELEGIQGQLSTLTGIEAEYESLLEQKENLLRQADPAIGSQLLELSTQVANLSAEEKELTEAIEAGTGVMLELDQAIDSLSSAEGWGTWDMLGGGLLATAAKHSKIDEARQHIHEVEAGISHFQRELADVRKNIDLKIDIGDFENFADYFFDGLIMDWIVQSKIEDSLKRAREAKDSIVQAVEELKGLRVGIQTQHKGTQEKRTLLIEQT